MALLLAPRLLPRLARVERPVVHIKKHLSEMNRTSCEPVQPAECAPCESAPPPACRRPPPECARGVRVTCCPPPRGERPPCAAPPPACARTCQHAAAPTQNAAACSRLQCKNQTDNECGYELDRVARRLAEAKRMRRLDYEREVATRSAPARPAPSLYRLAGERDCLRATDGRDYTVPAVERGARCGPCREPPPPCPVPLEASDKCEISRGRHLDPCAHHPRIFLEIDRSAPREAATSTAPMTSSIKEIDSSKCTPRQKESIVSSETKHTTKTGGLKSRIMESFRRNTSCPRQACESSCAGDAGVARRAGDGGWCASPAPPAPAPPHCRDPTVVERLKKRPRANCHKPCDTRRSLHTATCEIKSPDSQIKDNLRSQAVDKDTLESILRERSQLKEAGRGRLVVENESKDEERCGSAGGLELKVPSDADAVRVRVTLDFDSKNASTCSSESPAVPVSRRCTASYEGSDSWLSIKNLQKKFSGRRKQETGKVNKETDYGVCRRPNPKPAAPTSFPRTPCTPPLPGAPPGGPRSPPPPGAPAPPGCAPAKRLRPQSPCAPYLPQSKSKFSSNPAFMYSDLSVS